MTCNNIDITKDEALILNELVVLEKNSPRQFVSSISLHSTDKFMHLPHHTVGVLCWANDLCGGVADYLGRGEDPLGLSRDPDTIVKALERKGLIEIPRHAIENHKGSMYVTTTDIGLLVWEKTKEIAIDHREKLASIKAAKDEKDAAKKEEEAAQKLQLEVELAEFRNEIAKNGGVVYAGLYEGNRRVKARSSGGYRRVNMRSNRWLRGAGWELHEDETALIAKFKGAHIDGSLNAYDLRKMGNLTERDELASVEVKLSKIDDFQISRIAEWGDDATIFHDTANLRQKIERNFRSPSDGINFFFQMTVTPLWWLTQRMPSKWTNYILIAWFLVSMFGTGVVGVLFDNELLSTLYFMITLAPLFIFAGI
jgi:hypothetical protein